MSAAGLFADTSFAASDSGFDSGALRAELDVGALDAIELCDGLGSEALCVRGALTGAGALGSECDLLGAEDAGGGEKPGAGLGAGAATGALGAGLLSWC